MWRPIEGEQVVDFVEVSVQTVIVPLEADHHILDRNARCETNGILNVQFLWKISAPIPAQKTCTYPFRNRRHVLIVVASSQKGDSEIGRGLHVRPVLLQKFLYNKVGPCDQ